MALHADSTDVHIAAYFGNTNPGAVGAGKFWVDTTTGPPYVLKIRNTGNTAWEVATAGMSDVMTTAGDMLYRNGSNATARLAAGEVGQRIVYRGDPELPAVEYEYVTLNFLIDGGDAVIATGVKGDLVVDFAGVIVGVTMLADQPGSIVVDIWKDTYANYPPTVADTITGSAKPTITTALKSQNTTLTGWTTAIAVGDILRFNVDSVTAITRVTLALKVRKA